MSSKENTLLKSSSSLSLPAPVLPSRPCESSSKDITSQEGQVLLVKIEELFRRIQLLESRSLTNERQDYIARRIKVQPHITWEDIAADEEGNRLFKGCRQDFYYHVRRVALVLGLKEISRGRGKIWATEEADIMELLLPRHGRIKEIAIEPDELKRYFDDVRTGPSDGLIVYRWLDKQHPEWNDDLRDEFFKRCGEKTIADADGEFEQVQEFHDREPVKTSRFRLKRSRSRR